MNPNSNPDAFLLMRRPPGGAPTTQPVEFVRVNSVGTTTIQNGNVVLPVNSDTNITCGAAAMKATYGGNSSGAAVLGGNHPWVPQDVSKSGWLELIDPTNDMFVLYRKAPGAAAGTVTTPFKVQGSDGKTYCTLSDQSVGWPQIAVRNTTRLITAQTALPANFLNVTQNTWVKIVDCQAINTRGGWVQIIVNLGAYITVNPTGGTVYYGVFMDGAWKQQWQYGLLGGGSTTNTQVPCPSLIYWDQPAAGNHTYSLYEYITANVVLVTKADSTGFIQCCEFA